MRFAAAPKAALCNQRERQKDTHSRQSTFAVPCCAVCQAKATGKSKGEEPPTPEDEQQQPNQDAAGMDADDNDDSAPDAAPQAHHSAAGGS